MPAAFVLQCLFSLTLLVTAVICLRVGSPRHPHRHDRDALWLLTGIAFLLHGIAATLHNVFGGIALRKGINSPVMAAYLRWNPVMNHGRTFMLNGLMVVLVVAALRRRGADRAFWLFAAAVLVAGFALGAVVGIREGRFTEAGHYSAVAGWDVVELLLVIGTLLVLLFSNAADRLLWGFYSAYGLSLALGVLWLVLFAQLKVAGAWHPPIWTLPAMRFACYLVMLALAARALALRKRGEVLPGMLEPRTRGMSSLR